MPQILPNLEPNGPLVVALAYDRLCTFEFGVVAEVFGLPRPELGPGWYRFRTVAIEPGPLRAQGGLRFEVDGDPGLLDEADLIVVPGWKGADALVPAALVERLVAAHRRGARLASICSGAFVLAATGLLDGRRAATHWRHAEALRRAYPQVEVDARVLYVEEDRIFTSAGSAAGIDVLLHIVRGEFGPAAANSVARRLVVPPHRSGGQAQFVDRPVPHAPNSRLALLLDLVRGRPAEPWTAACMAREAGLSERSLARRFAEALGRTPGDWLAETRLDAARVLLETTELAVEEVARRSGFGSADALRYQFGRRLALGPRAYRERFRHGAAGVSGVDRGVGGASGPATHPGLGSSDGGDGGG